EVGGARLGEKPEGSRRLLARPAGGGGRQERGERQRPPRGSNPVHRAPSRRAGRRAGAARRKARVMPGGTIGQGADFAGDATAGAAASPRKTPRRLEFPRRRGAVRRARW